MPNNAVQSITHSRKLPTRNEPVCLARLLTYAYFPRVEIIVDMYSINWRVSVTNIQKSHAVFVGAFLNSLQSNDPNLIEEQRIWQLLHQPYSVTAYRYLNSAIRLVSFSERHMPRHPLFAFFRLHQN